MERLSTTQNPAKCLPVNPLAAAAGFFLVGLALLALATPATAVPPNCTGGSGPASCGTGQVVFTDALGDAAGPATMQQVSDFIRVGVESSTSTVTFWVKVNSDNGNSAPSAPTGNPGAGGAANQVAFNLGFNLNPATCVGIAPTYTSMPAWTNQNVYTTACAEGISGGGSISGFATPPQWVCNEAMFTMTFEELGITPDPAAGTVYSGANLLTADASLAQFNYDLSGTASFTVGQTGAKWQNAPVASAAITGDNTVRVSWTQGDNGAQPVTAYYVYRLNTATSKYEEVAGPLSAATTFWDDVGKPVQQGAITIPTYSYRVSNVNCPQLPAQAAAVPADEVARKPGESLRSATAAVSPDFRPAAPASLTVTTASATSLALSWPASAYDCPLAPCSPAGTAASGVQGYTIYRAVSPAAPVFLKNVATTVCNASATCSLADADLVTGTNYCYIVRAYDGYQMTAPFTPPLTAPTLPNMSTGTAPAQCGTPSGTNVPPVATCTMSPTGPYTAGQEIQFTSTSTDDVGIASATWNFGAAGSPATATSTPVTASVTATFSGSSTVILTVTDGSGAPSSTSACSVTIAGTPPPVANRAPTAVFDMSPAQPHAGEPVTFVDASKDPDAGDVVAAWKWTFGDGTTSTQSAPTHIYASAVSYNACLIVVDSFGLQSKPTCILVAVQPPAPKPQPGTPTTGGSQSQTPAPKADDVPADLSLEIEGPASAPAGGQVVLKATSSGSGATTYTWQQAGGPTVTFVTTGPTAKFTMPTSGDGNSLFIQVTARDGNQVDKAGIIVVLATTAPTPTARISGPSSGAAGAEVALDATGSMDPAGAALTYQWVQASGPAVVIDGADTATPTIGLPDQAGQVVLLLAVDNGDASATAKHAIEVTSAGGDAGDGGASPGFEAAASGATVRVVPTVAAAEYTWDFGDGSAPVTSRSATSHTYATPGDYTIRMSVPSAAQPYSNAVRVEEGSGRSVTEDVATEAASLPLWAWMAIAGFAVAFVAVAGILVARRSREPPVLAQAPIE